MAVRLPVSPRERADMVEKMEPLRPAEVARTVLGSEQTPPTLFISMLARASFVAGAVRLSSSCRFADSGTSLS